MFFTEVHRTMQARRILLIVILGTVFHLNDCRPITERIKERFRRQTDDGEVLTDDDILEHRETFIKYDKNEDGLISGEEFRELAEDDGEDPTEDEVEEVIEAFDVDGNQALDFGETLILAKDLPQLTVDDDEVEEDPVEDVEEPAEWQEETPDQWDEDEAQDEWNEDEVVEDLPEEDLEDLPEEDWEDEEPVEDADDLELQKISIDDLRTGEDDFGDVELQDELLDEYADEEPYEAEGVDEVEPQIATDGDDAEEQVKDQIRVLFEEVDDDQDGRVETEDLKEILETVLEEEVNEEEAEELAEEADADGDNVVTYEELEIALEDKK